MIEGAGPSGPFTPGKDESMNETTQYPEGWPETLAQHGATPQPPVARPVVSPGAPPWVAHTYDVRPNSTIAVWALITGVVGVLAGWCMFGLPSIAAIILGHLGLSRTKHNEEKGRGMAVAGLVLGYVAVLPAIILTFWMIVGGGMATVTPPSSPAPVVSYSAFTSMPSPIATQTVASAKPAAKPSVRSSSRPARSVTRKAVPSIRPTQVRTTQPVREVYYANCAALRAVYPAGVSSGHPAYRSALDRDGDGRACERD